MNLTTNSMPATQYAVLNGEENVVEFTGIHRTKCTHFKVEVDAKENELLCKTCGIRINPITWLLDHSRFFSAQFKRLTELHNQIKEDQAELKQRSRTRCQHCRKMTAINLKHHKFVVVK